jgi:hypothetical protein
MQHHTLLSTSCIVAGLPAVCSCMQRRPGFLLRLRRHLSCTEQGSAGMYRCMVGIADSTDLLLSIHQRMRSSLLFHTRESHCILEALRLRKRSRRMTIWMFCPYYLLACQEPPVDWRKTHRGGRSRPSFSSWNFRARVVEARSRKYDRDHKSDCAPRSLTGTAAPSASPF